MISRDDVVFEVCKACLDRNTKDKLQLKCCTKHSLDCGLFNKTYNIITKAVKDERERVIGEVREKILDSPVYPHPNIIKDFLDSLSEPKPGEAQDKPRLPEEMSLSSWEMHNVEEISRVLCKSLSKIGEIIRFLKAKERP